MQRSGVAVYLESTPRKTFAAAVDWPGWSRSARDEAGALAALAAYGPRYAEAIREAGLSFRTPAGPDELRVVGHTSGLSAAEKRRLVSFLAPYQTGERGTADPSRWTSGRELEWVALRPELVVEIDFDHVSSGRIRHGAKLKRWREDKPPCECTYDQLSL